MGKNSCLRQVIMFANEQKNWQNGYSKMEHGFVYKARPPQNTRGLNISNKSGTKITPIRPMQR